MSGSNSEVDVAVVGAGAAGLAAAKTLEKAGVSYVVLEASHRIGGRAYTEEMPNGDPFDLGCHWLHSGSINPLVPVADRLGFDYRQGAFFRHIFVNGAWADQDAVEGRDKFLEDAYSAITAKASEARDASIYDVIAPDGPWAESFYYFMSCWTSCDVDEISVKDFAAFEDTEENWPVCQGLGALIARWGQDVPVTLNAAVEKIDWSGSQVQLASTKGDVRAKKVIITVSTGILGSGDIAFMPKLPPWKQEAIAGLPLGNHNRIGVALEDNALGPDESYGMTVLSDGADPLSIQTQPFGYHYAAAFTGGRHADWLERAGQAAAVDFAVERLKSVFGNDIAKHVTGQIVTAWRGDPWVRGAYSCALPGQSGQRVKLAEPIDERLYFAGEATSAHAFSTVHGAYQTGITTAETIAASLQGAG